MEHLTLVGAYWEQPNIFKEHWANLLAMPTEVQDHVALCYCDDGSQKYPMEIPKEVQDKFFTKLFRIQGDQPWRQIAARNICMKHSEGWAFMHDPDYMFNPGQMEKVLNEKLKRGHYYHPASRLAGSTRELHRSANHAIVHTEDFWDAGGYDEQFAGGYGYGDGLLFKVMKEACGFRDVFLTEHMDHYPKGKAPSQHGLGVITDAASPAVRDLHRNRTLRDNVLVFIRMNKIRFYRQHLKAQRTKFKWERVI